MKTCPKCRKNEDVILSGYVTYKGKQTQKHKCKKCQYSFSTTQVKNKVEAMGQTVIDLMFEGLSFSKIAHEVGTHRSTITNWIKKNQSNDDRLVTAEILTIQLYMEKLDVKKISHLTGIHDRIIKYWVVKNKETPVIKLPRLSNRKAEYNIEPKRKTYCLGYEYQIHYLINNRKISIGTCPEDIIAEHFYVETRENKLESYPPAFKRLRLCQLYLAGVSKKDLRIALKYPKMINVKKALIYSPEFIRTNIAEEPSTELIIRSKYTSPKAIVELASGIISTYQESTSSSTMPLTFVD